MMSNMNPSLLSVSATPEPEVDDLDLSQFHYMHVPESLHCSSVHEDDPYSLDVDLGDVEISFTNLTEQYAPHVQAPLAAAQPAVVEQAPVDSPARDDEAPAVGNPST